MYNCIIGGARDASAILRRARYVRRRASIHELRRTYCSCVGLSWQRRGVSWATAAGVTAVLAPVAGGRRQIN